MIRIGGIEIILVAVCSLILWLSYKFINKNKSFNKKKIKGNNMMRKKKKDLLRITEKTIKYSGQTYQLSNITQVTKLKVTHHRTVKILLSIILGVLGLALTNVRELQYLPIFLFPTAIIIFIWAIFRRTKYVLVLETNSGSMEMFSSKNEKFIDDVIDTISNVIDDQINEPNIVINSYKQTIKNIGGDEVAGDKFSDNINSNFGNNSNFGDNNNLGNNSNFATGSNIGTASNTVIKNHIEEITKALDEIANHIQKNNDVVSETLLNELKLLVSQSNQDKPKIKSLWGNLVKIIPDVGSVAESVAKVTKSIASICLII
jgi:hypothetical protein